MGILRKLFGAKPEAPSASPRPDPMAFAVKASPETLAEEAGIKAEVFAALPDALRAAGVFRHETIDSIVAELQRHDVALRPVSAAPLTKGAMFLLSDGTMTTLDGCLTADAAADMNAVKRVTEIAGPLTNKVWNRHNLRRWEAMGVATVTLTPSGAPDVCPKMTRLRKRHPIGSVPEIPLAGCSAKMCFCGYQPNIRGVDE